MSELENTDDIMGDVEAGMAEIAADNQLEPVAAVEDPAPEEGAEDTGDESKPDVDWQKQFSSLQSMHDKQMNGVHEQIKALTSAVTGLTQTQVSQADQQIQEQMSKEQAAHNDKWKHIIAEDPERMIEYEQMKAQELIQLQELQMSRMEQRLMAQIQQNQAQSQPGWQERQEKAQAFAEKYQVPVNVALKIVADMESGSPSKGPGQPSRPAMPGNVGNGRPAQGAPKKAPRLLSAMDVEIARMCELEDKEIDQVAVELGQEA